MYFPNCNQRTCEWFLISSESNHRWIKIRTCELSAWFSSGFITFSTVIVSTVVYINLKPRSEKQFNQIDRTTQIPVWKLINNYIKYRVWTRWTPVTHHPKHVVISFVISACEKKTNVNILRNMSQYFKIIKHGFYGPSWFFNCQIETLQSTTFPTIGLCSWRSSLGHGYTRAILPREKKPVNLIQLTGNVKWDVVEETKQNQKSDRTNKSRSEASVQLQTQYMDDQH